MLSTRPNSSSSLTPSIMTQSLPQATAISELHEDYQINFSGPIPRQTPVTQSLHQASTPLTPILLWAKLRRLRERFSFKASASAWRSTITAESGLAAHIDQLNPTDVGHVTSSRTRPFFLNLGTATYCNSLRPPSQPAYN